MRYLALVCVVSGLLLVLGAKPMPTSHILGWDYAATAGSFTLDQCTNQHGGCVMAPIATLDGALRTYTVSGLKPQFSYCWQLQVTGTVIYSNIACSP